VPGKRKLVFNEVKTYHKQYHTCKDDVASHRYE